MRGLEPRALDDRIREAIEQQRHHERDAKLGDGQDADRGGPDDIADNQEHQQRGGLLDPEVERRPQRLADQATGGSAVGFSCGWHSGHADPEAVDAGWQAPP